MDSAKSIVRKLLDEMPEDSGFEDIQYHIYVREKIEPGLADIREQLLLSQEEVEKRMSRGLGRQPGPKGADLESVADYIGRIHPITPPHLQPYRR